MILGAAAVNLGVLAPAGETHILTVGTAALPASGTLMVATLYTVD